VKRGQGLADPQSVAAVALTATISGQASLEHERTLSLGLLTLLMAACTDVSLAHSAVSTRCAPCLLAYVRTP
jgi:hypothetical protein